MKERECPCCNENIDFKNFIKQAIIPEDKDEDGLICQNCKKRILSSEQKNKKVIPMMAIALAPFLIGSISVEIFSISMTFLLIFLITSILSVSLLLFGFYELYSRFNFECNQKSSKEYNENMTHF